MASAKEQAVALAITLIHTLVDEEQWQTQFREFFEEPELFHAIETRVESGVVVLNIYTHNPENLEVLIKHPFEFCDDDIDCMPTVEDACELTDVTLTRLRLMK